MSLSTVRPEGHSLQASRAVEKPSAGLLELEQLCSKQREAVAAAIAESEESQFRFEEARSDAHAATTYAVAVRGWALAAEREAQVALEVAAAAQDEELQARMRRRNRGVEAAEELAAEERIRLRTEEAMENQELERAEEKLKVDARESDELREMLQGLRTEIMELRSQRAPISARAAELRRRKHALEPATTWVGAFPQQLLPGLVEQVEAAHQTLAKKKMTMETLRMEEQQQEAEVMNLASEVQAQRKVTQELFQGLEPQELRLEAVEAREKWQEIAHRDEHMEWRQQMKLLQQKGREARNAKRAVLESGREVDTVMLQDSLAKDVADLEVSIAMYRQKLSELNPTTPSDEPHMKALEKLEAEMVALQLQRSTALERMEVLRKDLQAAPQLQAAPEEPPPETRSASQSPRTTPGAVAKRSTKQLSLQLSYGTVRRESLQKQLHGQKQEEDRLRRQLKEIEHQLQLSRNDAERRRNFVSQLQRCLETEQSLEKQQESDEAESAYASTQREKRLCSSVHHYRVLTPSHTVTIIANIVTYGDIL
eukprot:Skav205725  [mRNA]  locus=scaffold1496:101581:103321:+ [translate_table: standard]